MKKENTKYFKEFVDEEDKETYLDLCENLFGLAEDFNREQHIKEALIIKDALSSIVKHLEQKHLDELDEVIHKMGR